MRNSITSLFSWVNPKSKYATSGFNKAIRNRLCFGSQNANLIVARAESSSNKLSRWIIIYQRKVSDIRDEYFKLRYTIQDFEVPNNNADSFSEIRDKVNKKTWYARKEEEIYEVLERIGIHPQNFGEPSAYNYPFE